MIIKQPDTICENELIEKYFSLKSEMIEFNKLKIPLSLSSDSNRRPVHYE